jgi:hypothetical protein
LDVEHEEILAVTTFVVKHRPRLFLARMQMQAGFAIIRPMALDSWAGPGGWVLRPIDRRCSAPCHDCRRRRVRLKTTITLLRKEPTSTSSSKSGSSAQVKVWAPSRNKLSRDANKPLTIELSLPGAAANQDGLGSAKRDLQSMFKKPGGNGAKLGHGNGSK